MKTNKGQTMATMKGLSDGGVDANLPETLDDFFAKTQHIGSIEKAISNNLYGIDHQENPGLLSESRDQYGLAFFTRPQLNLSSHNLRNITKFSSLLSTNTKSTNMYVRNMLDPRLFPQSKGAISSLLVDHELSFIPILTNNCKSMSGWPDIVLPTYSSKEGVRRQQLSMGDGSVDIYDSWEMDVTFRNTKDEPITKMMQTWVYYISYVYENMLSPYIDMITENEIDYNTRIYRVILDESKRFVKKISATGASFPINVPMGRMFDLTKGSVYNDQNKDLNFRFKCDGAMYNDDRLIYDFNTTSGIFNKSMRDKIAGNSTNLIKIPYELLSSFNNRGYPYINPETFELEWYINKNSQTYKNVVAMLANK